VYRWTILDVKVQNALGGMMISQTAEYALRAMVNLAQHDGTPRTTRQIAEATQVPEGYLSKVLQGLSRSGLVVSQRGLGGGSVLARPTSQISVLDVVQAVDPLPRITRCPLGLAEHGERLCSLHSRLDQAVATVEEAFRGSTLADLLNEAEPVQPLCGSPVPGHRLRLTTAG
jgi:Rrf2 family transcriptional regulator, nitric oxide-sensitive transcriptional repressor